MVHDGRDGTVNRPTASRLRRTDRVRAVVVRICLSLIWAVLTGSLAAQRLWSPFVEE
jgi:hypothetical protein